MYENNSIKSAQNYPEVMRAIQHHQLFSQYGSALTPDIIDKLPYRYVQLLRLCIHAEAKQVKQSSKKQQFYSESGVTPASGARLL